VRTLAERPFHLLMATLVVASLFVDQQAEHWPAWHMPHIGLVTFALGLVWIALFAAYRLRTLQQRIDVLEDRLERTSRRADALEDETRRRRGTPTL